MKSTEFLVVSRIIIWTCCITMPNHNMDQHHNAPEYIKYLSGLGSGLLTAGIFHPIDSLRIRNFLNPGSVGDIRSLKNGIMFNILSTAIRNVVTFPIREQIRDTVSESALKPMHADICSSVITGNVMALIGTPINVIKVRMQNNPGTPESFVSIVKDIYRTGKFRGFYQGGYATALRDITWNLLYFPIYDKLVKMKLLNHEFSDKLLASISGSIVATSVSYPFDGLRLFRQRLNNHVPYSFWAGIKKSFEFSQANTKSYGYAIIRVPLATCLSHMSYLYLIDYLSKKSQR